MRMKPLLGALLAAVIAFHAPVGHAADPYPSRPVRLVVGFAPGGGADGIARVLADSMTRSLGQAVVVENRPGANTTLASAYVAGAAPDGYTLLLVLDAAFGADKALYGTVKYDGANFTPISKVASSFFVLAASRQSGIRSVEDLLRAGRGSGKPLFLASPGGANLRIFAADVQRVAGVGLEEVLYKGGAPAAMAVVSGEAPLTLMGPAALLPLAKEDKLTAVAITKDRRSGLTGELPTLAESGLPGVALSYWYGLVGPAGLPADVSRKLFDAAASALKDPAVQQRMQALGFEAEPSASPEDFKATSLREGEALRLRVEQAGIKPQ